MKKYLICTLLLAALSATVFLIGSKTNDLDSEDLGQKHKVSEKHSQRHKPSIVKFPKKVYSFPEVILDERVSQIIDNSVPFHERSKLVWHLQKQPLSKNAEDTLQAFLADGIDQTDFCVKNDTIETLIRKGNQLKENGDLFIQLLTDSSQQPVLREYILQYMAEYYHKRWHDKALVSLDVEDREIFIKALWQTSQETRDAIAGTSLITLLDISDEYDAIEKDKIFRKAEYILTDAIYSSASRTGSLHVLARSENQQYYDTLKEVAMNESLSDVMRIAAIHSAVQLNQQDSDMKKYLTALKKSKNSRLQKAAALNLASLK